MTKPCISHPSWPRCGASGAIFRGADVLLVQRAAGALKGLWSLPGGHIEPGEAARHAALREIGEETGVAAEVAGLLDIHEIVRRDPKGALEAHYLLAVFFGRWVRGEPRPGGDAAAARFVAPTALGDLSLTEGAPELIARARERLEATA